ncbi:MAG: ABC transporter ATP-binding protein [Bdellovibrionales bacterium]|nr:ABC transporter ATP-binding protein [Bdellovibrionales bacterium]
MKDQQSHILSCTDLDYFYGDFQALSALSFTLMQGHRLAVLGPNGSGKSTLLKILSTVISSKGGELCFLSQPYQRNFSLIRQNIGVVFQSPSLDRKLTVLENLQCYAQLFGIEKIKADQRIDELSQMFDLGQLLTRIAETLSGGQFRRVEIAKAMLHRPKLLLLDEPSTGLDPSVRRSLWQLIDDVKLKEGISVMFSTHFIDEAQSSDEVMILDGGKKIASGKPEELVRGVKHNFRALLYGHDASSMLSFCKKQNILASDRGKYIELRYESFEQLFPLLKKFQKEIVSLESQAKSLEDVYFSYTGKIFQKTNLKDKQ